MEWFNILMARLRALFRRESVLRDIEEELRVHVEMETETNIERGMPSDEARATALKSFGNLARNTERGYDIRGGGWLEPVWQDLRYGARMLRKAPGFTAVAALALALGIGVNTSIFSIVNGFVLRPLPVEKPYELVAPFWGSKKDGEVWGQYSYANYIDLRDQNKTLSGLLASYMTSAGISGDANGDRRAEVAWGELVSSNYFDVLGVKPVLGRGFLPEENRAQNTHPVVVLGHAFWWRRFNSDATIVGKTIFLNGSPFTVVGVAPATFKGLDYGIRLDFWAPLMMQSKFNGQTRWENERGWNNLDLMGRLKSGVTVAQADADFKRMANNLAQLYPNENADTNARVVSEFDGRFNGANWIFKLSSLLASCVAGLVLLVACANVANLMLARAAERSKEIGIRLAIGAGRFRIVRQLLAESVLLALLGGALGWMFAYWGTALARASFPPFPFTLDLDVNPDLYVLKWMFVVTLSTGVIFGLAPALLVSRPDLVAALKSDVAGQSRSRRRWNLRGALVVTQVTISVIVLICAGLFLRSLTKAINTDLGFSTENLVTMMVNPGSLGYDQETGKRFYGELLRRIEAQPGVRAASLTELQLLNDSNDMRPVLKEGEGDPPPNQGLKVNCNVVAPRYFETIRTPLALGRDFTERDNGQAPLVAIVNQEYARKFYGGEQNALGKRIRIWNSQTPLIEIVGVAKDALYQTLYDAPRPYLFLPQFQQYSSDMTLLVSANAAGDLKPVAENVRREVGRLDARVPVYGLKMAEENLSYAYWGPRLAAGMGTAFSLLALLLAMMGLYSAMTYAVSQREREIGVRMALGAQTRDVLKLIISQGMKLALIGVVIGLAGAFGVTRLVSSLLFGVATTDPITFAGVTILLVAVALLACWIPARRVTKVDPLQAIRHE
jgi:putative ABC transport system permease protein